jgi:Family of unknown function (DUF6941)
MTQGWDPSEMTVKAMLCEYATMADSTLTTVGAGITRLVTRPEPPHPIFGALAVLTQVPWSATNQQHRLTIELVADAGGDEGVARRVPINMREQTWLPEHERGIATFRFNVGRPADMPPGADTLFPLVLPLFGRQLPQLGSYFFHINLNGQFADRVSFQVLAPATSEAGGQA